MEKKRDKSYRPPSSELGSERAELAFLHFYNPEPADRTYSLYPPLGANDSEMFFRNRTALLSLKAQRSSTSAPVIKPKVAMHSLSHSI